MTTTTKITEIERATKIDVSAAKSVDDVLAMAKLNYRVELAPLFAINPRSGKAEKVETGHRSVIRQDTGEAIAVVGSRYTPIQTTDFLEQLRPAIEDKHLRFKSVMSVDAGRVVVVEAELPEPIVMKTPSGKEDVLLRRVLYKNTYDGTQPMSLSDYLLRRWCANGATHMLGMESHVLRHTASAEYRVKEVVEAVGNSIRRFRVVEQNARTLLAANFTLQQMQNVAARLFPAKVGEEVPTRTEKARASLVELFHNGQGTFGKSAWDALNAVTEWNTHHRPVRGEANKDITRLRALWMGLDQGRAGYDAVIEEAGVSLA